MKMNRSVILLMGVMTISLLSTSLAAEHKTISKLYIQPDSTVHQLLDKARSFFPGELDSAIFYGQRSLEIIEADPEVFGTLKEEALNLMGRFYDRQGQLDEAEEYYQESLKLSQDNRYDSLTAVIYVNLGQLERKKGNYEEARNLFNTSLSISNETEDLTGQASTHRFLGNLYRAWGKRDSALTSYNTSIAISEEIGDKDIMANAYLSMGNWMATDGQFNEARNYYHEYKLIQEEEQDTLALVTVMMNLGNLDLDQGSYGEALEQYLEALRILEQREIANLTYANLHNNIGKVYELQREFDRSKFYLMKAVYVFENLGYTQDQAETLTGIGGVFLKEGKRDSAIIVYNQALELYGQDNSNGLANLYQRIGQVYYSERNYRQALQEYQRAASVFEENGADRNLAHLYNSMGATLYFLEEYDNAMGYYRQSLTLSNEVGDLQQKENALFNIYEVLELQGRYQEALDYHKQYLAVRTERINEQKNRDILELTTEYETEKKDAEITLLQAEQERNEALIQQQAAERRTLLIGLIALFLIIVGVVWWFVYKIRKEKVISEQNQQIYRQEIDSLMEKQQLESVESMLQGQDKERKRLAAELHDRLGSLLSLVKLYFTSMENSIPENRPELQDSFKDGKKFLDDTFEEVRAIIKEMNDSKVSGKGLEKDIQSLLAKIDKFGITIRSDVELPGQYTDNTELQIYRIAQEALSNALKYSHADTIRFTLKQTGNNLELMVKDNGTGFNTNEFQGNEQKGDHYGLENMENRAKLLGGSFDLNTGEGKGVEIKVSVPIETPESDIKIAQAIHD